MPDGSFEGLGPTLRGAVEGANTTFLTDGHKRYLPLAIEDRLLSTDGFSPVADSTLEGKGVPGKSSYRALTEFGPPGPPSEERCEGFDFESPVPSGSSVLTFADFSQLYAIVESGYTCGNIDGARSSVVEFSIVGGTGRFEGATGTATAEFEGVALGLTASATGTVTGTATIGN